MKSFRADLHIHTVLSPCGDLEMSPSNIIHKAKEMEMDCIGITDHNSTLHAKLCREIGREEGVYVFMGAEVTSQEEAHCLCFFDKDEELDEFQDWLDERLIKIELNEERFGYQLVVNREEEIIDQKEFLLTSAIDADLDEIFEKVVSLNGLFIPAHINKGATSLISQLGFVPPDIKAHSFELTRFISKTDFIKKNAYLKHYQFIHSSDSHFIDDIGSVYSVLVMKELSFDEFRLAVLGKEGRRIDTIII